MELDKLRQKKRNSAIRAVQAEIADSIRTKIDLFMTWIDEDEFEDVFSIAINCAKSQIIQEFYSHNANRKLTIAEDETMTILKKRFSDNKESEMNLFNVKSNDMNEIMKKIGIIRNSEYCKNKSLVKLGESEISAHKLLFGPASCLGRVAASKSDTKAAKNIMKRIIRSIGFQGNKDQTELNTLKMFENGFKDELDRSKASSRVMVSDSTCQKLISLGSKTNLELNKATFLRDSFLSTPDLLSEENKIVIEVNSDKIEKKNTQNIKDAFTYEKWWQMKLMKIVFRDYICLGVKYDHNNPSYIVEIDIDDKTIVELENKKSNYHDILDNYMKNCADDEDYNYVKQQIIGFEKLNI